MARATDIQVLVLSGHPVIREALTRLVQAAPGLEVVVPETSGKNEDLAPAVKRAHVVVLDVDSGYDVEELSHVLNDCDARVIWLTSSRDPAVGERALSYGASGVLHKQHMPEMLTKAIGGVHAGELWISRDTAARVLGTLANAGKGAHAATNQLTRRELEVVRLVARGLNNAQIAATLGVSVTTVRNHLTAIFRKLQVSGRFRLAMYAFSEGLAEVPPSVPERRRMLRAAGDDLPPRKRLRPGP
jgi:DNA-binding NarL/FixJ family response regulator